MNIVAKGNVETIHKSGFNVSKATKSIRNSLPMICDLTIKSGDESGMLSMSWSAIKGAKYYEIFATTNTDDPNELRQIGTST